MASARGRTAARTKKEWAAWDSLEPKLSAATQEVLAELGFDRMTPVQSAAIPLLLNQRKDVAVQAQTGSGKTLAFLIPAVELLSRRLAAEAEGASGSAAASREDAAGHPVNAIIISPTRELALQICAIANRFAQRHPGLTVCPFVGGSDIGKSEDDFKVQGGRLLVGTPGRLESSMQTLIRSRYMSVENLDLLILDEADRLLDLGFEVDLDSIIRRLPRHRRTGLFSATQTRRVQQLSRVGLRNPTFIDIDSKVSFVPQLALSSPEAEASAAAGGDSEAGEAAAAAEDQLAGSAAASAAPDTLRNYYQAVEPQRKLEHMVEFVRPRFRKSKIIVFFLTCAQVDYFLLVLQHLLGARQREAAAAAVEAAAARPHKKLKTGHGSGAGAANSEPQLAQQQSGVVCGLHGQMVNKRRLAEYERFVECESGILLCTDVAARGVDIPDVDWIIQFDCPKFPDSFIHRIGRTARMGRRGNSLVYLLPNEEAYVGFMHQQRVKLEPLPAALQPQLSPPGSAPPPVVSGDNADNSDDDGDADEGDSGDEGERPEPAGKKGAAGKRRPSAGTSAADSKPQPAPVASLYSKAQLQILELARGDRNVMEKGQRAFVSFVRAYKEHSCSFIFVLAELALADCAHGWGLLFYPVMPDTKHLRVSFANPIAGLRPDSISFKEKHREKQRLANAGLRREKREAEKRQRLEKEKQRQKLKGSANQAKRRKKRAHQEFVDEWNELQEETRLHRRLRQGKISKKEYHEELQKIETHILEGHRKTEILKAVAKAQTPSEGALENEEIQGLVAKKKRKRK